MSEKKKCFPDLEAGRTYEGRDMETPDADPIHRLLGVGAQGKLRYTGTAPNDLTSVALYNPCKPPVREQVNPKDGIFRFYFMDRGAKKGQLRKTKPTAVRVLETLFGSLKDPEKPRQKVPPTFVFEKRRCKKGDRSAWFVGLVVPGTPGNVPPAKDLVVRREPVRGKTPLHYLAHFTILDARSVPGEWMAALARGEDRPDLAPEAFREWKENGTYNPLPPRRVVKTQWRSGKIFWGYSY